LNDVPETSSRAARVSSATTTIQDPDKKTLLQIMERHLSQLQTGEKLDKAMNDELGEAIRVFTAQFFAIGFRN